MALMSAYAPDDARSQQRARRRERSGAFILTLLLHLLVLAILLWQHAIPVPVKKEVALKAFMLMPDVSDQGAQEKSPTKTHKAAKTKRTEHKAQPKPPPPVHSKQQPTKPVAPAFIEMSSADFASSDISGKASVKTASTQGDSKPVYGPGEGPGGAVLYAADWYRPPSDAQLAGYLRPDSPRTGWGMIACRTIADYHVDDCIQLGESPLGSGFARAVRQAAWQFLVMPPRINGKPMIGTWVRIRITYTESGAAG